MAVWYNSKVIAEYWSFLFVVFEVYELGVLGQFGPKKIFGPKLFQYPRVLYYWLYETL